MPQISIGTWTFVAGVYEDHPVDLDTVLQQASGIGYQGVALGGFEPHGSLDRYPNRSGRKELYKKAGDLGLKINSYAADLLDCDFYMGAQDALSQYFDRFDRNLEFCVDCEIPIIRVDTVTMTPYPAGFDYKRAWETTIDVFRSDAEKAGKAGVMAVWEFEPGRLFNKPSEIMGILQAVNDENFKIQYDTAHGQLCSVVGAHQFGERETLPGGQTDLIELFEGKIGDVHLIDTDDTMRNNANSNKVLFGAGVLNFEHIIPAILSSGYSGEWWTVDLGPQEGDVWTTARKAYRYVSQLLSIDT